MGDLDLDRRFASIIEGQESVFIKNRGNVKDDTGEVYKADWMIEVEVDILPYCVYILVYVQFSRARFRIDLQNQDVFAEHAHPQPLTSPICCRLAML